QEVALAAARRPDQGGDGASGNGDGDGEERLGRAVPEAVRPHVQNRSRTVGRANGQTVTAVRQSASPPDRRRSRHPNLPVMYASVCSFVVLVNSSSVRPSSTKSPR